MADQGAARVALITGAANGFGWSTAQRLAKSGHSIILVDRAPEVMARAEELRSAGSAAHAEQLDVIDADELGAMMSRLLDKHERIDILVNNAGVGFNKPGGGIATIEEVDLAAWSRVVAINLTAPFLLAQAVVPGMKRAGWGRIVNISSRAGRTAVPASEVSYSATKAGLIGLTRRLAEQVAAYGVTVNAIAPGRFDTVFANRATPEVMAHAVANIPAKRIGHPDELAAFIAFLVSDEAGYMTGAVLDVNGGSFIG